MPVCSMKIRTLGYRVCGRCKVRGVGALYGHGNLVQLSLATIMQEVLSVLVLALKTLESNQCVTITISNNIMTSPCWGDNCSVVEGVCTYFSDSSDMQNKNIL